MINIFSFSFGTKCNKTHPSFSGKEQQLKKTVRKSTLPVDRFQKMSKSEQTYKSYSEIIIRMVQENKLRKEMAAEIGKSEKFVSNALKFLGIKIQNRGKAYEQYREVITQMVNEGKSRREMADEINKNEQFISNALKFLGIKIQNRGRAYQSYKEIIINLAQDGKSRKEMAAEIDKSEKVVAIMLRLFGIRIQNAGKAYEPYREIITQMVNEGKSIKEIATTIKKSESFVGSVKAHLGLTHPRINKEDTYKLCEETITQMLKDGKSRKEMAAEIGKSEQFISSALKFLGIKIRNKGKTYEPYRKIITQMVNDGKSRKEIAEEINKDESFVGSAKAHFGLTHSQKEKGSAYEPYREIITQMVNDGKSRREIAEKIKKNIPFVSSAKTYFGLTQHKNNK